MTDLDFADDLMLGTGYALLGGLQDSQTEALLGALASLEQPPAGPTTLVLKAEEPQQAINALDFTTEDMPADWDAFIGQDALKAQLRVRIQAALQRGTRLPHVMLASPFPGVGKTHIARLIAQTMKRRIIEMVPPFNIHAIVDAALRLEDGDILFIDEVHKLADSGGKGAEILLTIMVDHVAYIDGKAIVLPDITLIGATTNKDRLPEPVIDRFKIKPDFSAYTLPELVQIAITFASRHDAELNTLHAVTNPMAVAIARACRDTPRIADEMVLACADLVYEYKRPAEPDELLAFLEVEPDGIARPHIKYITSLRQFYGKETKDDQIEYVAGETTMMNRLREDKPGIGRIERFLVDRGLIVNTPRGRRLTDLGVRRAEEFIAAGKGASHVA